MAVGVNVVSTFDSKGIDKAIKDFKKLDTAGQKAAYSLKTFDRAVTNGAVKLAKFGAAAAIAGGLAVAGVVTDLAKAFLIDGELSQAEVDEVFKKASKGKGGK